MKYHVFFILILFSWSVSWSVSSDTITLQQAYEKSLKQAPSIAAQKALWHARLEESKAQKGALQPQINFNAGFGKMDTTRSDLSNSTPSIQYENDSKYWNISVQQALYRPDIWYQWKQYNYLAKSELARISSSKKQLFQKISTLYLKAISSYQRLTLHQQMLKLHQQQLTIFKRRINFGQATIDDIAQTESKIAQDKIEIAMLEAEKNESLAQLSLHLGQTVKDHQLYSPLSELIPLTKHYLKKTFSDLEKKLIQNHPDIQALKYEVQAATEVIKLKQANHKPRVDVILSRRMSSNDSENTLGTEYQTTSLSIQLSIPLYSGGSTDANVKSAHQRLTAAKSNLNARSLELKQKLIQLHSQLKTLYQRYLYNQVQVDSAKQVLITTKKKFTAGQTDKLEVIKSSYLFNKAKSYEIDSIYQLVTTVLQLHNFIMNFEVSPPLAVIDGDCQDNCHFSRY